MEISSNGIQQRIRPIKTNSMVLMPPAASLISSTLTTSMAVGNLACNVTGSAFVRGTEGMTPFDLLNTAEWKESYNDNNYPHFSVFGGGYGEYTIVAYTEVTVNVEGDYSDYDAEVDNRYRAVGSPSFHFP